jgi:hypothetical protein
MTALRFGAVSEEWRAAQDEVIRAAFSGDGDALDRAIERLRALDEAERQARAAELAELGSSS